MKCATYFFPLHYLTRFTVTQNIDTISKQCFPQKLHVIEMVFYCRFSCVKCSELSQELDTAVFIYVDGAQPGKFCF